MVTYDPCGRLNIIYNQLVPSILNSAENDTSDNIRKAIEHYLPKLEDKSYSLAGRCDNCNTCSLCKEENIRELFSDTRNKLENIWVDHTLILATVEVPGQMILA